MAGIRPRKGDGGITLHTARVPAPAQGVLRARSLRGGRRARVGLLLEREELF